MNGDYQQTYPLTKEKYDQKKWEALNDPEYLRLEEEKKREVLDEFFSQNTYPYLLSQGATEQQAEEHRESFINKYIAVGSKKKDTGDVSLQAEEKKDVPPEFPEFDLPDVPAPAQQIAPPDVIQPPLTQTDVLQLEELRRVRRDTEERADKAVPEILANDEFSYIKDNPGGFLSIYNTGERDRIVRHLKRQDYETHEIRSILPRIERYAEMQLLQQEKEGLTSQEILDRATEAAQPLIEGWSEGTFFDPETGMHRKPETDQEQDVVAYMEEFFNSMAPAGEDEPAQLSEAVIGLEGKAAEVQGLYQEVAKYAEEADREQLPTYLVGYWDRTDKWKKAQLEYIQQYREVEGQIDEHNKQVEQKQGQPEQQVDREKVTEAMKDAYLKYNYWEHLYQQGKKAMEGEKGSLGISKKTFEERLKKRNNARAEFQAAALMALKNVGPMDISKDSDYLWQIAGNAAATSLVGERNMLAQAQPIDKAIMHKLAEVGNQTVGLTEEELKHIEPERMEYVAEIGGGLAPEIPMLFMMGAGTRLLKAGSWIERGRKGYKVLRNPVLKKGGKALKMVRTLDDPVPVGWEVIKEVKPTRISQAKSIFAGALIDEGVFTGLGGFAPGTISGMHAANGLFGKVRYKGKLGKILAPYLNTIVQSGVGATAGMEAGSMSAQAVDALFKADKSLKDAWDEQWGNMSEAGKRVLAEMAINSLVFGLLHLYTTASAKKLSDPLGGPTLAYMSPKYRARVMETAKEAEKLGYVETAEALNNWLDLHKEPINTHNLKRQRIAELTNISKTFEDTWLENTLKGYENAITLLENTRETAKYPVTVRWTEGGREKELTVPDRFRRTLMLEDLYENRGVLNYEKIQRQKTGRFKQPKVEGEAPPPPRMLPEGVPGEVFPDQTITMGYDVERAKRLKAMEGFENNRFGNPEEVLKKPVEQYQNTWYEEWAKTNEEVMGLQKKLEGFKGRLTLEQKKEREATIQKIDKLQADLEDEFMHLSEGVGQMFADKLREKKPEISEEELSAEVATFQEAIGRELPAEQGEMPLEKFMDIWILEEGDVKKPQEVDIDQELAELEGIEEPAEEVKGVSRLKALLTERGQEGISKERLAEIDREIEEIYYEPGEMVTPEEKTRLREEKERKEKEPEKPQQEVLSQDQAQELMRNRKPFKMGRSQWMVEKATPKQVKVYITSDKDLGTKHGQALTFTWDGKGYKRQGEYLKITPQKAEPPKDGQPSEKGKKPPVPKPGDTEQYREWVMRYSEDPEEIVNVYEQVKSEDQSRFEPWQDELLDRKINRPSFVRFGDENSITQSLALGWFEKKDPERGYLTSGNIDVIAQELSEGGVEVTPEMIVDFITQHPNKKKARQRSPIMGELEARYREVTGEDLRGHEPEKPAVENKVLARILDDIGRDITPEGLEDIRKEKFQGFPYDESDYRMVKSYLEGDQEIDIDSELKDFEDLFDGLEFEYGAPGAGGSDDHAKLAGVASGIIKKFSEAGIKGFPEIVNRVAAKVEQPKMEKILPYLQQQAVDSGLPGAKEFHPSMLEGIYAQLRAPKEDSANDLLGKRIRLHPPEGVSSQPQDFQILAIELWNKRDPGLEKYGPLFAENAPGEKVLVAVVEDLSKMGMGRKGIVVDDLRELLKGERAEYLPDFEHTKERNEMIDQLALEYESIGMVEFADKLRRMKDHVPISVTNENWKEPLQRYQDNLENHRRIYEINSGRRLLDSYEPSTENSDDIKESLDRGKKKPVMDFAHQRDPELWDQAMEIHNKILEVNAKGGYNKFIDLHKRARLYEENIRTGYPWVHLQALGTTQMGVVLKYKNANPERAERLYQLVVEAHKEAKGWPQRNSEFFIKQWVKNRIHNGEKTTDHDMLRHLSSKYGFSSSPARMREIRELAYVEVARDIALQHSKDIATRLRNLASLYSSMTTLVVKDADSKVLQEYSTPPPLAMLMGEYVNGTEVQYILDPTAGNGMLFINTMPETAFANEISEHRLSNLHRWPRRMMNITSHDASQPWPEGEFPGNMRGSIMGFLSNPPFGSIDKVKIDDHLISKLEHQVMMNSLPLMNDAGKAAIILGGHLQLDPNGRIDGFEQYFYNWLYKNYNVDRILNISADLYARMGTKWPVRLVLINGRKPSPGGVAPAFTQEDVTPAVTWQQVLEAVQPHFAEPNKKIIPAPPEDPAPPAPGPPQDPVDVEPPPPTDGTGAGEQAPEPSPPPQPPTGTAQPPYPPPPPGPPGGATAVSGETVKERRERAKKELAKREAGSVVSYRPRSEGPSGGTVLPATMANEIEDALYQLEGEVGSLDDYVQEMLGYESRENMYKAFYAEQIDGLAMAVFNMENGEAVIIGDQTGVGKGRIAAGVLRYAVKKGYKPVFMTETANLFSDIYRDLIGIDSGELRPFMMNTKYEGRRVIIEDPDGNELYKGDDIEVKKVLNQGRLDEEHDIMLITYSQIRSEKSHQKRELMEAVSRGNIVVMDESHNAAGDSQTGAYMQEIIQNSQGAIFLSATYAKRPDNFPLYSIKSVVGEANMSHEQLAEAMQLGGPALQEIVSSELVSAMQLLRRERDMSGIEVNYRVVGQEADGTISERGKEILSSYNGVTEVMREIVAFQRNYVRPYIKARNDKMREDAKKAGIRTGTQGMGVYNHPYFSKAHNVIDQMLLSLKVDEMADMAIAELKAGKKPFITFKSTMEAQFSELDFEPGEKVRTDFSIVLERGLKGVMKITVTEATGEKYPEFIEPAELGPHAQKEYYRLIDRIREMSTGITASPIDMLRRRIEAAGFKFLEITGRGIEFELSDDGSKGVISNRKRMPKNEILRLFNNQPGYAIGANAAGATGLSAHAAPEFLDHSQRIGIDGQPNPDVNKMMQIRGRINRSGQVTPPIYHNVSTLVPAELRLLMMAKKKLKSLDANTTSNQNQNTKVLDMEDFFDKYGDQVVVEYLEDNPELNRLIGDPLNIEGGEVNKENAAHRVSGKLAILDTERQEEFYTEVMDRYKVLIDYLNQTDQNDLVVAPMNLEAVTKDTYLAVAGRGGYSAFGDDSNMELVEVNALKRPMMKKEIQELVNKELEGKDAGGYRDDMRRQVAEGIEKSIETQRKDIDEYYDQRIKDLEDEVKAKLDEGADKIDVERERQDRMQYLEDSRHFRHSTLENNSYSIKNRLDNLVDYFLPGQVYEVPYEKNPNNYTRMNKGVFLGFSVNTNKKNPWIPSNFKMRFATSDSRRSFMVPASKKAYIDSIIASNYSISERERNEFWEDWDKHAKGGDTRVHRWVITGNILQAFSTYEGRLIEFTTKDGQVRKGILMPESFQPNEMESVTIAIRDAYNIIRSLPEGDYIESTDGDVVIRKGIPPSKYDYWAAGSEQHYTLSVPDSRKRGAKYWDRSVSKLPGKMNREQFEKYGDRMQGYFSEERLRDILDYLDDKFRITLATRRDNVSRGSSNAAEANYGLEYGSVDRQGLSHPGPSQDLPSNGTGSMGPWRRISVDALDDGKPAKKVAEIHFIAQVKMGARPKYQKPRSRKAAGTYSPGTGKIALRYANNLDVMAHELGHYLDDVFGLVSPEYEHRFPRIDTELKYFWIHGSDPPKGMPWKQQQEYKRAEGVAEWIRAWLVNPRATKDRTPIFTEWFEDHVPEDMRAAMREFGDEIRRYHAQTPIDRIGSHIELAEMEPKGFWSAFLDMFRRGDWNKGNYKWSFGDRLIYNWFTSNHPWEKAFFEAAKMKGFTKKQVRGYGKEAMRPTENAMMLGRLLAGHHDVVGRMLETGIIDPNYNMYSDVATKQPLNVKFIFDTLDKTDLKTFQRDYWNAMKYAVAKRTISYAHTFQFDIVKADLEALPQLMSQGEVKLPPTSILDKHPYLAKKYEDVIQRAIEFAGEQGISPEDAFHLVERYDTKDRTLTGIGGGEFRDWDIAEATINNLQDDPETMARYDEFLRRYELVADAILMNMVKGGRISEELYEYIQARHLHYLALRRVMAVDPEEAVTREDILSAGGGSDGLGIEYEPERLKKITGSERMIADPMISLIHFIDRATHEVNRNRFMQAFTGMLKVGREMYQEDPQMLVNVGTRVKNKINKYTEPIYRNGIREWWEFDPVVHASLTEMNAQLPSDWITFAAGVLRSSVILSPVFATRNLARDLQNKMVISPVGTRAKSFLGTKKAKELFQYAGGGQFGFYVKNQDDYLLFMKQAMYELAASKGTMLLNPEAWKDEFWEKGYKRTLAKGEVISRLVQFNDALAYAEKHYPDWSRADKLLFAAYHSRNLLDFAVGGVVAKRLSRYMVFFNPRIQGWKRYWQGWRDYPEKMWPQLMLFSILPAALASYLIASMDDETQMEYKKLPVWRRDLFYNIPLPGGSPVRWISIPKPFEAGVIGSLFQRVFDRFLLDDEHAIDTYFFRDVMSSLMPFDENSFLSTFQGVIMAVSKYDNFRRKYIVPPHEINKDIRLRNTESASEFGRHLMEASAWINKVVGPEHIAKPFMDPRVIDAVIQAQTSYFGRTFLRLYETAFGDPEKDTYYRWDWSSTGWFRRQEVYGSIDVQWVISRMREADLYWSDEYQDFNNTLRQMYEAETPQQRRALGVRVLEKAQRIRAQWEGRDFVQERIDEENLPPAPRKIGPRTDKKLAK